MKVKIWGSRGSLPTSVTADMVRHKIKLALEEAVKSNITSVDQIDEFIDNSLQFHIRGSYGNNTACVEVDCADEYFICDAGSGIRDLSVDIMEGQRGKKKIYNIFMSHLHWDHIQGFPFFIPAYVKDSQINIYGFHDTLVESFFYQQNTNNFPITLNQMSADISFHKLEPMKEYDFNDLKFSAFLQDHPGDSYGFIFEKDGKKFVYSTDAEHSREFEKPDYPFLEHFRDADLLIFDAQYRFKEALEEKKNWGHSSNIIAVELSVRAGVKKLCLFHNEPGYSDLDITAHWEESVKYLHHHAPESTLEIIQSFDGLEVEL